MLHLTEPGRWQMILNWAIRLTQNHQWLATFAPIWADIFLLIYPIFLVIFYLYGIIKNQIEKKIGALFIFFSCFFSLVINLIIQCFFTKPRPINIISGQNTWDTILHKFLPESSFPSDHAVVGMSVAVATILRGIKTKNKKLTGFGVFLVICAVMMGYCRILTTVHRPSDIVWGFLIWIIVPMTLYLSSNYQVLERWLLKPIVRFQEWVFSFFKK